MISADSAATSPANLPMRTPTPTGSVSAPVRSDIPWGSLWVMKAGMLTYWANAPGRCAPTSRRCGQS